MRLAAVACLALLLACSEDPVRPAGAVAEADSADQRIYGFTYNVLRGGIRRSRLEADTAFYFDSRQLAILRQVRATFFGDDGTPRTTLAAERMEYDLQTGSMRAEGAVTLVGPDGQRLSGQSLTYDVDQNTLASDEPFVLLRGAERLEGDGFEADADFTRFQARRPRGVTAPGEGAP